MVWPFSSASPVAGPSTSTSAETPGIETPFTPDPATTTSSADSLASTSTLEPIPLSRWEVTLADEERLQEKQYPRFEDVPACMTLMDEFFSCYALIPQVRSLYRRGTMRDCTYKWNDFKYCLSLKQEDDETRRQLWIKRKAEWWSRRRVGPSSEDIWETRKEPLANWPPMEGAEVPSGIEVDKNNTEVMG